MGIGVGLGTGVDVVLRIGVCGVLGTGVGG